jgi:hypothetical protein
MHAIMELMLKIIGVVLLVLGVPCCLYACYAFPFLFSDDIASVWGALFFTPPFAFEGVVMIGSGIWLLFFAFKKTKTK